MADLADSASQASQASSQVTDAVGEISKGAVSQAESVEDSANNTGKIGNNIEDKAENVGVMEKLNESFSQQTTQLVSLMIPHKVIHFCHIRVKTSAVTRLPNIVITHCLVCWFLLYPKSCHPLHPLVSGK